MNNDELQKNVDQTFNTIETAIRNKDNHFVIHQPGKSDIIVDFGNMVDKFSIETIQCQCGKQRTMCILKQESNIYIQELPCTDCGNYMATIITQG
jgi:hypothetical protein